MISISTGIARNKSSHGNKVTTAPHSDKRTDTSCYGKDDI